MKKFRLSTLAMALVMPLAVTFSSCNDDDDKGITMPEVKINDATERVDLSFKYDDAANPQTVTLSSNDNWETTISNNEDKWLTVTPANGPSTKETKVTLTVTNNDKETSRSSDVFFKIKGKNIGVTVKVTQNGNDSQRNYISIADLRAKYTGELTTITDDVWVKGSVISNYRNGDDGGLNNATSAKSVVVSDGEAGIALFLLENNKDMARGDEVVIKLEGQKISGASGGLQLVADYDAAAKKTTGFPNENISRTGEKKLLEAKAVTVADFVANKHESMYVALPEVQVTSGDLAKTFATASAHTSINMESKDGDKFVIFSSKYATFKDEKVPQGSGTLKGVTTLYNGTQQISISDVSDYAGLTGERFGEKLPETATTIPELIARMTANTAAAGNFYLDAVVVTDMAKKNFSSGGLSIMTEGATTAKNGVLLFKYGEKFTDANGDPLYNAGDRIRINLNKCEIQNYRHASQTEGPRCREIIISDVSAISKLDGTATIAPVAIPYDQIEDYQGMLVTIADVQSRSDAADQKWVKNTSLFTVNGDLTKEVNVFIAETSDIIGQNFLTGKGTLTGIAYVYGGSGSAASADQIVPRSYADVSALTGTRTSVAGFEVTDLSKTILAAGASVEIEVKANVEWAAVVTEGNDFVDVAPTPASGNTDATVKLSVKANDTTEPRTIKVKISTTDAAITNKEFIVTITQAGKSNAKYTLISKTADITAGTYFLAGFAKENYHIWKGTMANKDCATTAYSFANNSLTPTGDVDDAAEIQLIAVDGKANTYHIKVGDKYLTTTSSENRNLALQDKAEEWVFADATATGNIGISPKSTTNPAYLRTSPTALSALIRSYKAESTSSDGIHFFKKQ